MTACNPRSMDSSPLAWIASILAQVAGALAGVWLLQVLGVTGWLGGFAYDHCLRTLAERNAQSAHVLLAEIPRHAADLENVCQLIRAARESGARHIAILGIVPDAVAVSESLRGEVEAGFLTLGRFRAAEGMRSPQSQDARSRREAPSVSAPPLVVLPPAEQGIHRTQVYYALENSQELPVVETAVARRLGVSLPAGVGPSYGIAFRGGPGSLPNMPWEHIVAGNLVPELVRGKVVLMGFEPELAQPGLTTPTTVRGETMPLLEFHGHALNTLLSGSAIGFARPGTNWLLLAAAALVVVLIAQRCAPAWLLPVVVFLFLLDSLLAPIVLASWRFWLPWSELGAVQLLGAALAFSWKARSADRGLSRLARRVSARLRERRWPASADAALEPWPLVAGLLDHIVEADRFLLLPRLGGKRRLGTPVPVRCSLDDVVERLHDLDQLPWAELLASGQPLRLDERPLLRPDQPGEIQYLIGLCHGRELFGFLVAACRAGRLRNDPDLASRLQACGEEAARFLYEQRLASLTRSGLRFFAALRFAPEAAALETLSRGIQKLTERVAHLETLFEGSEAAAAFFDPFGRRIMMNGPMHRLLQEAGKQPAEMHAAGLLETLTGWDPGEIRRVLNRVMLEHRRESFTVDSKRRERSHRLTLSPLETPGAHRDSDGARLRVRGLLCELADRNASDDLQRWHEQLTGSLESRLRNDLAAVELAASLLQDDELPAGTRRKYGEMIHGKVRCSVARLEECQRYLLEDPEEQPRERRPVNAAESLLAAMDVVEPSASVKGVSLHLILTDPATPALAAPRQLTRVFRSLLELLVEDAIVGSEITSRVEVTVDELVFQLENRGFGVAPAMPDPRSPRTDPSDGMPAPLREAKTLAEAWGGMLSCSSRIGEGTRFRLALKRLD